MRFAQADAIEFQLAAPAAVVEKIDSPGFELETTLAISGPKLDAHGFQPRKRARCAGFQRDFLIAGGRQLEFERDGDASPIRQHDRWCRGRGGTSPAAACQCAQQYPESRFHAQCHDEWRYDV